MRLNIKKKHVLALPNTASRLAVRSYKNISSVDFDVRPLQRTHYILLAVLVFAPTLSTLYLEIIGNKLYTLTKAEKAIVATTSVKKELIKTTEDAYTYNRKEELKGVPNGSDPKLQELLLSANKADSTGKEPYQASLSKDPTKGLTFGDAEGNRQFTLTPNFGLSEAKLDDESRVVYPVSTTERSIYTFKKNGIKNDITLLEAPKADPNTDGTTKTYKYTLSLGKDLEARLLPSGDVGIYSADPTLFGNIQVGDEKSQELVDKARNNGEKNTLAFEIPKPFIIDSSKKMNYDDVSFKLEPNQKDSTKPTLTLEVRNLKNLPYPLSIDPTITVTTTNDFLSNTGDTGNVDFSTSGQITRGFIGSGALDDWSIARGGDNVYTYVADGSNGISGTTYRVHRFTFIGSSNFTVNSSTSADYLIIAGGGGGGSFGGGGGAGGLLSGTAVLAPGTYTITVGDGGAGATTSDNGVNGSNGSNSTFNGLTAIGGGGGGTRFGSPNFFGNSGNNGGSGGGASNTDSGGSLAGGFGTANQGNSGGAGGSGVTGTPSYSHGGGGGAGGAGMAGKTNGTVGASGGAGLFNSITGTRTCYASGGGGGVYTNGTKGLGGLCVDGSNSFSGGGGDGGGNYSGTILATNGTSNTGGGGGGGAYTSPGGKGGSGVVIIRYAVSSSGSFGTARINHTSVSYNGFMYLIGGFSSAGNISNVSYASINTGSIGSWNATTSLPVNLSSHSSVVYNGYIYVIGGSSLSSSVDTVYYALVCTGSNSGVSGCSSTAGSLGSWQSTTNLPAIRARHSSIAYNGYVYVIGGTPDGTTMLNTVIYAPINSNGTLGSWSSTTSFTNGRQFSTSNVFNGYVYIIGGINGATNYNDVQFARINSNGTLGSWSSTSSFTNGRYSHASVVNNGYVYIFGGAYSTTVANDTQYAPINSNGTLGAWSTTTSLLTARYGHSSVAYGGYIYVAGGMNSTGTLLNTVEVSSVLRGGTSSWTTNASTFTTARWAHATVAYNGYLYVLGGYSGAYLNDVQYAPICDGILNTNGCASGNSNIGKVGTWATTSSFTTGRYGLSAIAYSGYMYIIGGCSAGFCTNYLDDIQYALICTGTNNGVLGCTSNVGTVGSWTSVLPTGGTITNFTTGGISYRAHTFTSGGTLDMKGIARTVDHLVVGGGGASGPSATSQMGGGGGGRAIATSSASANGTSITITVGSGGNGTSPINGGSSSVSGGGLTTTTAGGGLSSTSSAGGASGDSINAGGTGGTYCGGGGGGSGGAGSNATAGTPCAAPPGLSAGAGGSGTANSFQTGASQTYGGGGGGTAFNSGNYSVASGGSGSANCTSSYGCGGRNTNVGVSYVRGSGTAGVAIVRYTHFTPRFYMSSFIYNGYVYVTGGVDSTGNKNDTWYALICTGSNNNIGGCGTTAGMLGTWVQTTSFTNARSNHKATAYNGYAYIVGGVGAAQYDDVQFAQINSNGTLGTWNYTFNGASSGSYSGGFNYARHGHSLAIYNGYIYIAGGSSGNSIARSDVQYALICTSANGGLGGCSGVAGTIGTWQYSNNMPNSTWLHDGTAYNGFFYNTGGYTGAVGRNDVQYASIGPPSVANNSWADTTFFATPRTTHTSVASNGIVYVIGGLDGSGTRLNSVQYATIQADGTLNAWQATTNFPVLINNTKAVAYNGYIYVIGGSSSVNTYESRTWYVPICTGTNTNLGCSISSTPGTLGNWTLTNSLRVSRAGHGVALYDGYVYALGGDNGGAASNDVQYAPINSDGTLGTWNYTYNGASQAASYSNGFTTGRTLLASKAYNGYVYISGGWNGTTDYKDVQYALLCTGSNSGVGGCSGNAGTVGTWNSTNTLVEARRAHSMDIVDGAAVVIGGISAGYRYDIEQSRVLPNGSVETWELSGLSPSFHRRSHATATWGGRLYITGGDQEVSSTGCKDAGTSTVCNNVKYASLRTISNSALYERTIDTGSSSNSIASFSLIGASACSYNVSYATAGSSNSYGATSNSQALAGVVYSTGTASQSGTTVTGSGTTFTSAMVGGTITYSYGVGTASQSGTTVTGSGTTFTSAMVGGTITFSGGQTASITGFTNATTLTVSTSQTIAGGTSYTINYGTTTITGITSATALTVSANQTVSSSSYVISAEKPVTINASSVRYIRFSVRLDDSSCGGVSTLTDLKLNYISIPNAPTLQSPENGAINVSTRPVFSLGTTDSLSDFVRYKIDVCTDTLCNSIVRTIDQTSSQSGWTSQSAQLGTAYTTSASSIVQYALHNYQAPALSNATTYYWRGYAIDPGDSNTWSAASSIFSFTTEPATRENTIINGNTTIYGGSTIR